MVTLTSMNQDGSSYDVFLKRFSIAGIPLSCELQANTWTTGARNLPKVAGDASGDFVVVWEIGNKVSMESSPGFEKGPRATSGLDGLDCEA
jgi:hypothetical protein